MEKDTYKSETLRDSEKEQRLKYKGSKDWFFCPEQMITEQIGDLEKRLRKVEMSAFGIDVFTDSERLCEQIRQFNNFNASGSNSNSKKRLFYVTDKSNMPPLPNPSGGIGLVEMSAEPADVLCDPSSGLYVINCWDRFTSMESLVLGMHSYDNLRNGKLGMHAALIEKDGYGYVLIGKPKTGKTTISLSLAAEGFHLISDDWVEVEEREGQFYASGINPSISLDQQTLSQLQSKYGQYKDIEQSGFSSYGKNIMPIKVVNDAWNPEHDIPVRKTFILDNDCDEFESIDSDYFLDLLKTTDPHTPFMNVPEQSGVRSINGISDDIRIGIEDIDELRRLRGQLAEDFVMSTSQELRKFRNKDHSLDDALTIIRNQI